MRSTSKDKIALCYAGLANLDCFAIEMFLRQSQIKASEIDLICCFWDINVDKVKVDAVAKKFNNAFISYVRPEVPKINYIRKYFKYPETNIARVISMFFIRRKLLSYIQEKSLRYDAYIFTRPDVFFTREIKIIEAMADLGKKHDLYFPLAGNYRNGLSDVLLLANYKGLEVYLSAFDGMKRILRTKECFVYPKSIGDLAKEVYNFFRVIFTGRCKCIGHSLPFHPESITRKNIELSGLGFGIIETGEIIISRGLSFSILSAAPKKPSFTLMQELVAESIDDVDFRLETLFKI